MSLLKMPYTNLHELNLDWLIEQLNKSGAVISVNGKAGIVTLTGEDINRTANNPQTVEQALAAQGASIQTARNEIGVTPLPTTAQTLTGAIAEHETDITGINTEIGTTPLPTTAQTLTGAIAENAGEIADIEDNVIGSAALPTTAQTLTGAIAELDTDITNINNDIGSTPLPTTAQTITGAIDEHETDINNIKDNITVSSQTSPAAVNVASGAFATIATLTGLSGIYAIEVDAAFGSSSTGIRILLVDTAETDVNNAANSVLASGRASLQKVRFFSLVATDVVYIRVYHNIGEESAVSISYKTLKVK